MLNVRAVATKATTLAEIMSGRDKLETEELIKKYPEGVTINDCEVMELENNGEPETVWVYTVSEEPKKFLFAGTVLKRVFEKLLSEANGDYTEVYAAVQNQRLPVVMSNGRTKNGQKVTVVRVI